MWHTSITTVKSDIVLTCDYRTTSNRSPRLLIIVNLKELKYTGYITRRDRCTLIFNMHVSEWFHVRDVTSSIGSRLDKIKKSETQLLLCFRFFCYYLNRVINFSIHSVHNCSYHRP